ncbi:MAG: hypothetical protein ACM3JI_05705, partial [Anaerolineae bacterium]
MTASIKGSDAFFSHRPELFKERGSSQKFRLHDPRSKTSISQHDLFKNLVVLCSKKAPSSSLSLSGYAKGATNLAGNSSSVLRRVGGVIIKDSPGLTIMGVSTLFSFFNAFLSAHVYRRKIIVAKQIDDRKGLVLGNIGFVRSLNKTMKNGLSAIYLVTRLLKPILPQVLQPIIYWSATLGAIMFDVYDVILGIENILNIHWGRRFKRQFYRSFDPKRLDDPRELAKAIHFFQDKLLLSKADKELCQKALKPLKRKCGDDPQKMALALRQEALKSAAALVAAAEGLESEDVSDSKYEKTALKILSFQYRHFSKKARQKKVDAALEKLGRRILIQKCRARAEAKITRLMSDQSVQHIKRTFDLSLVENLKSSSCDEWHKKQAVDFIAKAKKNIRTSEVLNSVFLAICILGVIVATLVTATTFVVAPGWLILVVIPILFLLISVMSFVCDIYLLNNTFKSSQAKHDKNYLVTHALVGLVALSLAIFLSIFLSLGPLSLIFSCMIGAFWLSQDAFILYKLHHMKNEKK